MLDIHKDTAVIIIITIIINTLSSVFGASGNQ
jgi:hypothetical protein